ncbi:Arc family DNA-binding protein [Aquimarina sp. 2201CG1-2-11]|uniref:Arc family DNA-binding protein n=1 Tax=Aquimarina discodermiae TaxID=3231043 RepID=UPI0034627551
MSKRKSFVLRIDPETFKQIEKWADDEFRSVNGQIEWILSKSLKEAKRLPSKQKPRDNKSDKKS